MTGMKLVLLCSLGLALAAAAAEEPQPVFKIHPVGAVQKKDGKTMLRIHEKYAKALTGLDGFSHVAVLYWFDRNDTPAKRSILQVHPRGNPNNPLTGVFACRSPVRPNLIAFSVCRIRSVEGNVVFVEGIDAFDSTPIIDLKPHIPSIDCPKDVQLPVWLKKR